MATIITKNSSTAGAVPTTGDLVQGEIAVNVTDKKLYTKNASGAVVQITPTVNDNGFKNRIINGAMTLNQRGISGLSSGVGVITYTVDRMFVYATGAAVTVNQYIGANFGSGITSVLQVTGAAGNTNANIGQRIEAANTKDLAAENATVSFWLYQNTGSTQTITTNIYAPTATDNWTSQTTVGSFTNSVPSGTWTYCKGTLAINSNAQYGLGVATGNIAVGSGQQFAVGNFQLEKGSTATSFDYRPYGAELALCRYYARKYATAQNVNDLQYEMRSTPAQSGSGPYLYTSEL